MTNFKSMIFDFGNVVAYFDHHKACRQLADFSPMEATNIHDVLFASDRLNDRFERGELKPPEFLQELRGTLEIDPAIGDRELKQAWNDIFRPNPDVMERLVDFKQECRLILASNTNPLHVEHLCAHSAFQQSLACFDVKVLSYEVGHRKPDSRFYEQCVKAAECEPAECLFFDDMPENVRAARNVGMQACVYVKSLDDSIRDI
jgi:glucose-1-phosphatase